jgi:hypothetical protein
MKIFHNNHKKQGGDGVPLPKPSLGLRETSMPTFDVELVRHRSNTQHNPLNELAWKTNLFQDVVKSMPIYSVISFLEIQLHHALRGTTLPAITSDKLISQKNVIMDMMTRYKGCLTDVDDITQHFTKSHSHDFGDYFENGSATRDGSVLFDGFSC